MRILIVILLVLISNFSFAASIHIAPTLDTKLENNNSLVYCPTLLVAWDKLGEIIGKPIQFQNESTLAEILNAESLPGNVLPPDSYVAMAGPISPDILNKKLKKKFGKNAPSVPSVFRNQMNVIIAYCHFQRMLPFPKKFIRSRKKPLKFSVKDKIHEVQFFGATKNTAEKYSDQVDILNYKSEDEFTISIKSKIKDEVIVLSKMLKPKTFTEGIATVKNHVENKKILSLEIVGNKTNFYRSILGEGDLLAIPVINFYVNTNFFELCNRKFINQRFTNLWINNAYQDVKFKLDETGAYVESTAGFDIFCSRTQEYKPRRFIFDKPFLVSLWRKNSSQPYLALWVATDDVLLPFGKK